MGGVSTAELNRLEMKFLFSIDFRLQVSVEMFGKYCSQLEKESSEGLQIERPFKACGIKESWSKTNKDDSTCAPTVARWKCGIINHLNVSLRTHELLKYNHLRKYWLLNMNNCVSDSIACLLTSFKCCSWVEICNRFYLVSIHSVLILKAPNILAVLLLVCCKV